MKVEVRLTHDGQPTVVECRAIRVEIERRERVKSTEERFSDDYGASGKGPVRTCQKYEVRQPEMRTVVVYEIRCHEAKYRGAAWKRLGLLLAAAGMITFVLAWRGNSPYLAAAGGLLVTFGLGIPPINRGGSYSDYAPGSLLYVGEERGAGDWADDEKQQKYEFAVGSPYRALLTDK